MRTYILYALVLALISTIGFSIKAVAVTKEYYFSHGYKYMKLGKYKPAIEDFIQVISLDPENEKAYFLRGIAYNKVGQYQQAVG